MMDIEALQAELQILRTQQQELLDRQAIRDCLARYCRGIDRFDTDLIMSAYHPDAIDDHVLLVDHPGAFAAWANDLHATGMNSHQHMITTHNCELDGDVAHTETYWMMASMRKNGPELSLGGGRYVDRFERREGAWKIAARKVLFDWGGTPGTAEISQGARAAIETYGQGSRDRSDPSYRRPLTVDPKRFGFRAPYY
jgi:ketosteroid isomerase-like protein